MLPVALLLCSVEDVTALPVPGHLGLDFLHGSTQVVAQVTDELSVRADRPVPAFVQVGGADRLVHD